jgi:predicted metal-dependent phosphoesterase TrpH
VTNLAPVDLHTHSSASDGTASPADVVRLAHGSGLSGVALTDHDTVAGVAEASAEARRLGIDFLAGIELSCSFPRPGTLHVLGYGIDPKSPAIRKLIAEQCATRDERNRLILERLNHLGLDLHWDEVIEAAGGPDRAGSIGRPHLASLLVRKGYAASSRQAFDLYLGGGGAAYVDTNRLSAERAFATVRAAGGIASLAHPLQLRRQTWAQLESMVRELSEQGLEAIETMHSGHDADTVAKLTRLADRLDLLTTGGSDFHGTSKPGIRIGRPAGREVPRGFFDRLVARVRDRKVVPPRGKRRPEVTCA